MNQLKKTITIFFIFIVILHTGVCADNKNGEGLNLGDDSPSSSGFSSDFSTPSSGGSASVPPPNPIIINGVQIKDYRGLSASGNSIKFSLRRL